MRYTKMAAVATLCLCIMSVAAFTTQTSPEAAPRPVSAPQSALETFYVPAQHVNAGAAGEKPVHEYY